MNFALLVTKSSTNSWYEIQQTLQKHKVKDIWLLPEIYQTYVGNPWHALQQGLSHDLPSTHHDYIAEASHNYTLQHKRASMAFHTHYHTLMWYTEEQYYTWHPNNLYHPTSPRIIQFSDTFSFDQHTHTLTLLPIDEIQDFSTHSFYYVLIQQQKSEHVDLQTEHTTIMYDRVSIQVFDSQHNQMSEIYQTYTDE